jgi:menaquinone-specific isochorismate synthase
MEVRMIMSTASEQIPIHQSERIQEAMMAQLKGQLTESVRQKGQPVILRAEVCVEGLKALSWLRVQDPTSRGYWSNRDEPFELAGVGGADVITGDSDLDYSRLMGLLHDRLSTAHGNPRYFGGMCFHLNGSRDPAWRRFKAYRFILPRFEVVANNGRAVFACNMLSHEDLGVVDEAFSHVVFPGPKAAVPLPRPLSRCNHPDEQGWLANVEAALKAFRPGEYEKVVLARMATFEFAEPLNAAVLLQALKKNTASCFHFLFQPHACSGFLGASPERLYRRDGDLIRTEAIAGSRPRGALPQEDQALARELLASEKELREHGYVVDGIRGSLEPLCGLLTAGEEPVVLKLSRCQHLITPFKGRLRRGVKDAELLESLHPTPAVGGYPKERALGDISRLEPFDRGWYAGPVGWIAKDSAQFVVGIRSGLTEDRRLHLFSGAGIVEGSVPGYEWEEIENKISDFVTLLSL